MKGRKIDMGFFEVEKIVGERINQKGQREFQVKWQGWEAIYNTWEPYEHVKMVKDMIFNFYKEKEEEIPPELQEIYSDNESLSVVSIAYGDLGEHKPKRILGMKKDERGTIRAFVEWHIDAETGIVPLNSWIDRELLKKKYLRLLVEYYESIAYLHK